MLSSASVKFLGYKAFEKNDKSYLIINLYDDADGTILEAFANPDNCVKVIKQLKPLDNVLVLLTLTQANSSNGRKTVVSIDNIKKGD